jgi:tetratricopeptide (TPR) repeat protein
MKKKIDIATSSNIENSKSSKGFSTEFFEALADILCEGNYVSHLSALYLHGIVNSQIGPLTIVSNRRRRSRQLCGLFIRFVSYRQPRKSEIALLSTGVASIPVATPCQALIDLVSDLKFAPDLAQLATLFASVECRESSLLKFAENVSDTVLKRTAFLLAWSGRLTYDSIPFYAFSSSPARLDSRLGSSCEMIWDNRFKLFYPSFILSVPIPENPWPKNPSFQAWLVLRRSLEFRKKMLDSRTLIIRNDRVIPEFLKNWLPKEKLLQPDGLKEWLTGLGLYSISFNISNRVLRLFSKNIASIMPEPEFLLKCIYDQLPAARMDFELLRAIIRLALVYNDSELLDKCLKLFGEALIESGHTDELAAAAELFISKRQGTSYKTVGLLARVLINRGRYASGETLLSTIDPPADSSEDAGWYWLAKGYVLHRFNNFSEALKMFKCAEDSGKLIEEENFKAKVYLNYGCVYIGMEKYANARKNFHYAWRFYQLKSENSPNIRGVILGNLGIVEVAKGELSRGCRFLHRACNYCRKSGNAYAESLFLFIRAKALIGMGELEKSLRLAKRAYSLRKEIKSKVWILELCSHLSWVSQLLGREQQRLFWHQKIFEVAVCEWQQLMLAFTETRAALFAGKTEKSVFFLNDLKSMLGKRSFSRQFEAEVSMLMLLISPVIQPYIENRQRLIKTFNERGIKHPIALSLQILQLLYFAEGNSLKKLVGILNRLISQNYYDPYWRFYIDRLLHKFPEVGKEYMIQQFKLSSKFEKDLALKSSKNCERVLAKDRMKTNSETGEILILGPGSILTVSAADYEKWKTKTFSERMLKFDGVTGKIQYFPNSGSFPPNCIPAKLLELMFLIYPAAIPISHLHRIVWNSEFDNEFSFDFDKVKIAVLRARRILASVCSMSTILLKTKKNTEARIVMRLPRNWTAATFQSFHH